MNLNLLYFLISQNISSDLKGSKVKYKFQNHRTSCSEIEDLNNYNYNNNNNNNNNNNMKIIIMMIIIITIIIMIK